MIMVKGEDAVAEVSWDISLVFIKQGSIIKTPIRKGRFHRRCIQPIKGLLCSNDYRVRKGSSGFQSIGKVNINNLSEESVGEESDICVISRIRGMVRAMR
jgi:hypothetical protein